MVWNLYLLPHYLYTLINHLLKIFMRQLKGAANQELEDSPVSNQPCVESFTNCVTQLLHISLCCDNFLNVSFGENTNPYNVSF